MMVVVIGNEQDFPENGITGCMRQIRKKIRFGRLDHFFESLQVFCKFMFQVFPFRFAELTILRRPIAFGPFGRDMVRIAHEFQDVPLGYAQMLHQVPGRVRYVGRPGIDGLQWKIGHGVVEMPLILLLMLGLHFFFEMNPVKIAIGILGGGLVAVQLALGDLLAVAGTENEAELAVGRLVDLVLVEVHAVL